MLSPITKRHIRKTLPFGIFWLIYSLIYVILERGIMGDSKFYPSTGNAYNFYVALTITPISSFFTGLFLGMMEIFWINKLFIHRRFWQKILYKTIFYAVFMLTFLIVSTIFSNMIEFEADLWDKRIWTDLWSFVSSFAFWSVLIYMAAMIMISLFYAEVSDNLGQEVFYNFFLGKYYQLLEEERIFMFLDMKSSTTIAEKIGHLQYFKMLKMYYADLSDAIVRHSGEIYQYVGDEVVVSWKLKKGLDNQNCIRCFFCHEISSGK